MTLEKVLEAVKELTGASDAKLQAKVTATVWSVIVSYPDGPEAFRFDTEVVILNDQGIRLMGR